MEIIQRCVVTCVEGAAEEVGELVKMENAAEEYAEVGRRVKCKLLISALGSVESGQVVKKVVLDCVISKKVEEDTVDVERNYRVVIVKRESVCKVMLFIMITLSKRHQDERNEEFCAHFSF